MISIIIPTYNCAEYLTRSVQSVLRQNVLSLEVIVVDDGSTDNTPAVCRQLAEVDTRVKHFRIKNSGQSAARNFGLRKASGNLIFFLDADDIMTPCSLKIMEQAMEETGADIVSALINEVSLQDADKEYSQLLDSNLPKPKIDIVSPEDFVTEVLYQTSSHNNTPSGKIYRREVLQEDPFPIGMIYEDLEAIPRILLRANRIATLDLVSFIYVQRPGSTIHTFSLKRADSLDATENLINSIGRKSPGLLDATHDRALAAAFNIFALTSAHLSKNGNSITEDERKKHLAIISRCKKTIRSNRLRSLLNPRVRMRNKLGIIASYIGGFRFLSLLANISYRG